MARWTPTGARTLCNEGDFDISWISSSLVGLTPASPSSITRRGDSYCPWLCRCASAISGRGKRMAAGLPRLSPAPSSSARRFKFSRRRARQQEKGAKTKAERPRSATYSEAEPGKFLIMSLDRFVDEATDNPDCYSRPCCSCCLWKKVLQGCLVFCKKPRSRGIQIRTKQASGDERR